MSRYLRYTLLTLLWVAVAAYIVFAARAQDGYGRKAGDRGGGQLFAGTSGLGSDGPPVDFTCRNQDTRHGS